MSSTLGRRYAKALLELATEKGEVDKIQGDLRALAGMWNESRDLRGVFENPAVTAQARRTVVEAIAAKAALSHLIKNTLLMLADRRRMRLVPELADAYEVLAEQKSGRVRAEVVTASPMPEAYYTQLLEVLEQATGKKVVLVRKQDPSLIGGVVTRVGDQVFDGSVKNRLTELREELLSN